MKFLVINRRNLVPMPPEQTVALFQASKAWVNARLADGTLDCIYVFADLSGGLSIGNADSHEELLDSLLESPIWRFFSWDIRALCDWSHATDKFIEAFEKLTSQ